MTKKTERRHPIRNVKKSPVTFEKVSKGKKRRQKRDF